MKSDLQAPVPRLERLSRLRGHDVARYELDPRGWPVLNREGRKVGEVKDLIVDTERMAATFLDVELDGKLFSLDDYNHILVPLDRAQQVGRRVVIDEISRAWVEDLWAAHNLHEREFWLRWWNRYDTPPEVYDTPPEVRES